MASRALIAAVLLALGLALPLPGASTEEAQSDETQPDEAMIELAWDSGCFNCHDIDEPLRGPPWRKVAARYRGDDEAFDRLVPKVIEGGGGVWGDDVMSPNRRVPEEVVRALVKWLLTLE
jgi:cytochrome c